MAHREDLAVRIRRELGVTEAVFGEILELLERRRYLSSYARGECSAQDILDAAQEIKEAYERIASARGAVAQLSPPGREGREVPKEVLVQLGAYSQKRAQVFSEVAATLADRHPGVREFRRRFLDSEDVRLTERQASDFLYGEHASERPQDLLHDLSRLATRLSIALCDDIDPCKP